MSKIDLYTREQNIRRFICTGEEVRFNNSTKPYVQVEFIKGIRYPKIKLSKFCVEGCYTRDEFTKVLDDDSWLDVKRGIVVEKGLFDGEVDGI